MTQPLTIKLFGGLAIEKGGEPVTGLVTQKAEVLLAYLACNPRTHSRELLATMLWDDRTQKQGLSNLRTLLTSLRRHLRPYLAVTRQTMALDWEQEIWVDVAAFEAALDGLMQGEEAFEDPARLEAPLALYTGDFMEGIFVNESREVEEWIAVTRERLRHQAARARERLATYYLHHRRYPAGIDHARELVRLDPLREGAHRLLMRLLARDGRQNAALSQYETCSRLLQEELGVDPAGETITLYRRIRRAKLPPPHQLPASPTPFVGRDTELATISRRLDDGHCRLLTLIGPGGAGKTRLAVQAANERRGDYLDGIFFVNLASTAAAEALPVAVANVLDLPLQEKQAPRAQLLNHLQEREMLLLLDNFEHLLSSPQPENPPEAVDLIQAILEAAPNVTLLITSRERLHLRAEWVVTVRGLPYAQTPAFSENSSAAEYEAMQLFTTCARRVRADFAPAAEAAAIARICRLLEGLPLGIELAAASLPQHTPDEIADAIRHNLDFLATRLHDVPTRHRSLRAAFAHSWALLSGAEREAFSRLSVFRGAFNREAARAVTGAGQAVLDALVAKSLLRRDESGRYDLHQTLRHYAAEKLAEMPAEETAARDRHSTHTLHFVQQQEASLLRANAAEALKAIVAVLDDVHAAWRWAAQQHDLHTLARSTTALLTFYSLSGLTQEGEHMLQAAIDQVEQATGDRATSLLSRLLTGKARLLLEQGQNEEALGAARRALTLSPAQETRIEACFQAGRALWRMSRYEEAQGQLVQALALCEEGPLPTPQIQGDILRTLGITAMHLGRYGQAEAYYRRALQADEENGSRRGEAIGLNQLGRVAELQGDFRRAQAYYERALPHFRKIGFRRGESSVLINLGNTLRRLGDYAAARDHLKEALSIAGETGDRHNKGLVFYNLGVLHRLRGDYGQAQAVSRRALRLMRQIEYKLGEANSLLALSNIALAQNHHKQAERLCREALVIYRTIDSPLGEGSALNVLGRLALRRNCYEEARSHLEAALSIGRTIESAHLLADATGYLSLYYLRTEQPEAALAHTREALALAQKTGVQHIKGNALTTLAKVRAACGDLAAAQATYREALALRRELGQPHRTLAPLAGLAHLALEENNLKEALARVEEILAYLAGRPLHGPQEPLRIYDTCQRVLEAAGDPRTTTMGEAAQRLAQKMAA
jgi:predicted ATPase